MQEMSKNKCAVEAAMSDARWCETWGLSTYFSSMSIQWAVSDHDEEEGEHVIATGKTPAEACQRALATVKP